MSIVFDALVKALKMVAPEPVRDSDTSHDALDASSLARASYAEARQVWCDSVALYASGLLDTSSFNSG